jgi:hypothetical protein
MLHGGMLTASAVRRDLFGRTGDPAVETILVTLQTRFGPVSDDMEAQVRRSPPDLLDDLFKRALTAASLELVFTGDSRH